MRAAIALAAVLGLARTAHATHHLIDLEEVLGSFRGDDTLQFVELRMAGPGQTALAENGAGLVFDDATVSAEGRHVVQFGFPDPGSGVTGARILVATPEFAQATGLHPDYLMPAGSISPRGGRVCYAAAEGAIDCVAYGDFSGDNTGFGTPTPVWPANRSLQRMAGTGDNSLDWTGSLTPTPEANDGTGLTISTLCGNGAIDPGETCDGADFGGETCASLGFARGKLACDQCQRDASGCTACGNGAVNGDEECDGADLGGRTCATLGFTGGTLACTGDCKLTTADCDPTFFVPGGGPRRPECLSEWRVLNAGGRPGATGKAPPRQRCKDGDAGCDGDQTPGTCTFDVAVCFDRDDARLARRKKACLRPAIADWLLVRPKAAGTDADLVAALAAAVGSLGPSTVTGGDVAFSPALDAGEVCTPSVAIVVPTRGKRPGRKAIKAKTTSVGPRLRDVDALKLECMP